MSVRVGAISLIVAAMASQATAQIRTMENSGSAKGTPSSTSPAAPSTGTTVYGAPIQQEAPEPVPKLAPPQRPKEEGSELDKNSFVNIGHIHPGNGWCRYVDPTKEMTYYSAVFPGNPLYDVTPRSLAFFVYLKTLYPQIPGDETAVACNWQAYDADYVMNQYEREDAYSQVLRNYHVTMTPWKP